MTTKTDRLKSKTNYNALAFVLLVSTTGFYLFQASLVSYTEKILKGRVARAGNVGHFVSPFLVLFF